MFTRDIRALVSLLILVGFIIVLLISICLFYNPIQKNFEDFRDDIIPQHYNLEFALHAHSSVIVCRATIFFQLKETRRDFSLTIPANATVDTSSIVLLFHTQTSLPIRIRLEHDRLIIKYHRRRISFEPGNYSISITSQTNLSHVTTDIIRQTWPPKHRVLFIGSHMFNRLNSLSHRSTFNINIINDDDETAITLSNMPLGQTSPSFEFAQIGFVILHHYQCRSLESIQLCIPISSEIDLFSFLLNITSNAIVLFESYFARVYPLPKFTMIAVLELADITLELPGLVLVDQNALLANNSAAEIIRQRELIFSILAHQWLSTLVVFEDEDKWMSTSLARTIGISLSNTANDSTHLERYMHTIVIDALCETEPLRQQRNATIAKFHDIPFEKGEALFTELRLRLGDGLFRSRIQQLIQTSNFSSIDLFDDTNSSSFIISGHPIISLPSFDARLFKFNSTCSSSLVNTLEIFYRLLDDVSFSAHHLSLSTGNLLSRNLSSIFIPLNPFVRIDYSSWDRIIDEIKTIQRFRTQSNYFHHLLLDSTLLSFANRLSSHIPLQLFNLILQQPLSIVTKEDLTIVNKLLEWHRAMLSISMEEKFLLFSRRILNPFCTNQLWTRRVTDTRRYNENQQTIVDQARDDLLLVMCCTVNHSMCLQQLSSRYDPPALLQFLLHNIPQSSFVSINNVDMLTSFNRLQVPSPFAFADEIVSSVVCQSIRQQDGNFWHEFIRQIQQHFGSSLLPAPLLAGLACGVRTVEQLDFYLTSLCPSSPNKWPCYRNLVVQQLPILTFERLIPIENEHWPMKKTDLVDFLFHISRIRGNFSAHPLIAEFQSLNVAWKANNNQSELARWLDDDIHRMHN